LVLLPRGSDDLQDNISRLLARPTLVRIEGDNAQNALVLTPENALDDGPLVSLISSSAVLTEVLKDCVDSQVLRRP
jgi:hypothetical protein